MTGTVTDEHTVKGDNGTTYKSIEKMTHAKDTVLSFKFDENKIISHVKVLKIPSNVNKTESPEKVVCGTQQALVDLKVVVLDGITLKEIAGALVEVNWHQPPKEKQELPPAAKTKSGVGVSFKVPEDGVYWVMATKKNYLASRRKPSYRKKVTVKKVTPEVTTLHLTVTDKLLIIGEGTDYGYAKALADRYKSEDKLKQVIATQFPKAFNRPSSAPENLMHSLGEFDVIKEKSFSDARALDRYGPDFGDFEAIIFNNPHYGYGGHMGEVLGVTTETEKGHNIYSWVFAHTMDFEKLKDKFNEKEDPKAGGFLGDYSTINDYSKDEPTPRDFAVLLVRNHPEVAKEEDFWKYRDALEKEVETAYKGLMKTRGFNDYLTLGFKKTCLPNLRKNGTLELNGSSSYKARLLASPFNFEKPMPFKWQPRKVENKDDPTRPYYAPYGSQHSIKSWHPSWDFEKQPNPPRLVRMRRYVIKKKN